MGGPATLNYPQGHAQTRAERDPYGWGGAGPLDWAERTMIARLDPSARTLEAGCGAGRMLAALRDREFIDVHGFDIDAGLLADARAHGPVTTQTGTCLGYSDGTFDQAVYLQQFLALMPDDKGRREAAIEAHRVLRPGGVGLFSFPNIAARREPLTWVYDRYLRALRRLTGSTTPAGDLPWLRVAGRVNLAAVFDRGPTVHWFDLNDAMGLLLGAGFTVESVRTRGHGIYATALA